MAKPATFDLTKENIFTICNELHATGKKVTGENVRERIGGGSPNIIMAILKEWKESNTTSKAVAVIEMPQEAVEAVKTAASIIWKAATEHQAQAIEAIRNECRKIEHVAREEQAEALEMAESLGLEVESLKSENEELQEKIKKLTEEKNKQELQIQKQQISLDSEVQKTSDLKKQIVELKTETATAQTEINRLLVIAAQHDAAQIEIKELKAELKESQAEVFKLSIATAQFNSDINKTTETAVKPTDTIVFSECFVKNNDGQKCTNKGFENVLTLKGINTTMCKKHATEYKKATDEQKQEFKFI